MTQHAADLRRIRVMWLRSSNVETVVTKPARPRRRQSSYGTPPPPILDRHRPVRYFHARLSVRLRPVAVLSAQARMPVPAIDVAYGLRSVSLAYFNAARRTGNTRAALLRCERGPGRCLNSCTYCLDTGVHFSLPTPTWRTYSAMRGTGTTIRFARRHEFAFPGVEHKRGRSARS